LLRALQNVPERFLRPNRQSTLLLQRVRRGEPLARIGNSGDARWPHLHFQVTTGPGVMSSEGLPFVLDHFRDEGPSGKWGIRQKEFPLAEGDSEL